MDDLQKDLEESVKTWRALSQRLQMVELLNSGLHTLNDALKEQLQIARTNPEATVTQVEPPPSVSVEKRPPPSS